MKSNETTLRLATHYMSLLTRRSSPCQCCDRWRSKIGTKSMPVLCSTVRPVPSPTSAISQTGVALTAAWLTSHPHKVRDGARCQCAVVVSLNRPDTSCQRSTKPLPVLHGNKHPKHRTLRVGRSSRNAADSSVPDLSPFSCLSIPFKILS